MYTSENSENEIQNSRTILNSDEEGNARIAPCSQKSSRYFLFSLKSVTNQPFNTVLENPITKPKKVYVIIGFFSDSVWIFKS